MTREHTETEQAADTADSDSKRLVSAMVPEALPALCVDCPVYSDCSSLHDCDCIELRRKYLEAKSR